MIQGTCPLRQYPFIRFVFHIKYGTDFPNQKQFGSGGTFKRLPYLITLHPAGECPWRFTEEPDNTIRSRSIKHNLGMRGYDDLTSELAGNLPKQVVHLALQYDMQMRIGLVKENHRRGPRVQEGKQEKNLKCSASGIGEIKGPAATLLTILAYDIRLGGRVDGPAQLDPKEIPDMPGEPIPFSGIVIARDLQKKIPQYLAGPSLADKQILHSPITPRFVAFDPRERRHMNDIEVPSRLRRKIPDGLPIEIPRIQGSRINQFGICVLELQPARPLFPIRLPLHHHLDQPPGPGHTGRTGDPPVLPEQVHFPKRHGGEVGARNGYARPCGRPTADALGQPPVKHEFPGRDALQQRRFPGIVRTGENNRVRQFDLLLLKAFEVPDRNPPYHIRLAAACAGIRRRRGIRTPSPIIPTEPGFRKRIGKVPRHMPPPFARRSSRECRRRSDITGEHRHRGPAAAQAPNTADAGRPAGGTGCAARHRPGMGDGGTGHHRLPENSPARSATASDMIRVVSRHSR